MGVSKLNNKLNIIGKNIKKYRELRNLSQNDVCCKMALLGITLYKSDIYNIEYCKRTIKDFELYGFSKILNVSFEQLFENVENEFE